MEALPASDRTEHPPNAVELPWLIRVRWAGILAAVSALAAGADVTDPGALATPLILLVFAIASNTWLAWRVRRPAGPGRTMGGWLVVADVVILSVILRQAGGVLNPASIFYLVDIVLAALVLGRRWAWAVALLSIGGYGVLFLAPPSELAIAGAMHPEIGAHVRGMWLAFAATASIVALLVSQLAAMVERRDRAIAELGDRSARDSRLAALTTLSAGAAHELSTPLATIAVAARELERAVESRTDLGDAAADVHLIREEVARCRRILEDMAARISEPIGEMPARTAATEIAGRAVAELPAYERALVVTDVPADLMVTWPAAVVVRALVNVLRNAVQASPIESRVSLRVARAGEDVVHLTVSDQGSGMPRDVRDRAGEPFFTTKRDGSGMGLGLFVTRSTIDQLGGSLAIDSRMGAGTVVTITLPTRVDGGRRP